jgi:hypothetical protein
LVGFLKNNDPGFARQPLHRQLEAAQAKLSTVQVIQ